MSKNQIEKKQTGGKNSRPVGRLVKHLGPIKNLATYRKKIEEFKKLGEELEIFEKEKWPIGKPPLTDLIETRLHELGAKSKCFGEVLGSKARASEILAGHRSIPRNKLLAVADYLEIEVSIILQAEQQGLNSENHFTTENNGG